MIPVDLFNLNKNKVVIFDIDGCLADCSHRLEHIEGAEKNWDAFFAAAGGDAVIEHNVLLMHLVHKAGAKVVLMTGRPTSIKDLTVSWFDNLGIVFYDALLMRITGDYRPDQEVKREMVNQLRREGHTIICAFDDRQHVVDMFIEEGIPCLQARAPDPVKMENVKSYEKKVDQNADQTKGGAEAQA